MKYEVILPFGQYKKGQIVDDSVLYIRRKIQEGGCLKPIKEEELEKRKEEAFKKQKEKKMQKEEYENKMLKSKKEEK